MRRRLRTLVLLPWLLVERALWRRDERWLRKAGLL